eukprot:s2686_g9.t1
MVAEEEAAAPGEAEAIPVGETVPPAQPPPEEAGLAHAISLAMREQYSPECSIYVGGLEGEDEIWPEQLYEHFKECGEVKRVCIKIDKASGERLGHAYVDFAEESQAEDQQEPACGARAMFCGNAVCCRSLQPSPCRHRLEHRGGRKLTSCLEGVFLVTTLLLSCAALSVVAYRESFAKIQQDFELELQEEEALQLRTELQEAFDAFEALEGDVALFGDMLEGRFAKAAKMLEDDPTSVFSRLQVGFSRGQNLVVVGAGGVGKTETIKLAMEDPVGMTKENRGDYVKGYAEDGTSAVKAEQLRLLQERQDSIKHEIGEKEADILFFDEVDLGNGFLNQDELDAMKLLLEWGNELAPNKSKVVVLHPLVSTQAAVHSVLASNGFPSPGDATWIDFSQPYTANQEANEPMSNRLQHRTSVQAAMITGILYGRPDAEVSSVVTRLQSYFMGMPNAYLPFLINKDGRSILLSSPLSAMRSTVKQKIGGRLIQINIGFQASEAARTGIKLLLDHPDATIQETFRHDALSTNQSLA